jgi:hypothetical protein
MKINECKAPLSLALSLAIEQLYATFNGYRAPTDLLDVCTHCCMSPELEKEMRKMPLRQLTIKHFYEYNTSAKSSEQPPEEIKYLLPRMLELLAQGAELHHSTELYLQRMGKCEATEYSIAERTAIDAFALAFFADGLAQYPSLSTNLFMGSNAFDILLMFDLGGVKIQPLLKYWLDTESVASTLHYAEASYWGFWNEYRIKNAFTDDDSKFSEVMKNWLMNKQNRDCFAGKILAINIGNMESANDCECSSSFKLKDIVESVFDLIAE